MPRLITPEYAKLNADLHASNPHYGTSSARWADIVRKLASGIGTSDILDYGCGKQRLQAALPEIPLKHYDPAIAGLDSRPSPADVVICTDVLEHVEPELIDGVLDDLARLTKRVGFFNIATRPAVKFIADGRNAHLIQQPMSWWIGKLEQRFVVAERQDLEGQEFTVVVVPRSAFRRWIARIFRSR